MLLPKGKIESCWKVPVRYLVKVGVQPTGGHMRVIISVSHGTSHLILLRTLVHSRKDILNGRILMAYAYLLDVLWISVRLTMFLKKWANSMSNPFQDCSLGIKFRLVAFGVKSTMSLGLKISRKTLLMFRFTPFEKSIGIPRQRLSFRSLRRRWCTNAWCVVLRATRRLICWVMIMLTLISRSMLMLNTPSTLTVRLRPIVLMRYSHRKMRKIHLTRAELPHREGILVVVVNLKINPENLNVSKRWRKNGTTMNSIQTWNSLRKPMLKDLTFRLASSRCRSRRNGVASPPGLTQLCGINSVRINRSGIVSKSICWLTPIHHGDLSSKVIFRLTGLSQAYRGQRCQALELPASSEPLWNSVAMLTRLLVNLILRSIIVR